MLGVIGVLVGMAGLGCAAFFGHRLYRWEQQLRGARIAIAYKGKVKMNQPLIDWLMWANSLDRDESHTGRAVYKANATTIAILKRAPATKAKTITRKEGDKNGTIGTIHRMVQRRRTASTRNRSAA